RRDRHDHRPRRRIPGGRDRRTVPGRLGAHALHESSSPDATRATDRRRRDGMTSYQPTRAGLIPGRLPRRPAAITALQLAFLAWAAVELAAGRTGNAVALVAVFAVLQVPRLLRLPVLFDVAFLVAWTLQELGQVAGFWSRFPWWDTLVHTALPAVLAPTAVILLIRAGALPDVLRPVKRIQAV